MMWMHVRQGAYVLLAPLLNTSAKDASSFSRASSISSALTFKGGKNRMHSLAPAHHYPFRQFPSNSAIPLWFETALPLLSLKAAANNAHRQPQLHSTLCKSHKGRNYMYPSLVIKCYLASTIDHLVSQFIWQPTTVQSAVTWCG